MHPILRQQPGLARLPRHVGRRSWRELINSKGVRLELTPRDTPAELIALDITENGVGVAKVDASGRHSALAIHGARMAQELAGVITDYARDHVDNLKRTAFPLHQSRSGEPDE
ncbi:hypothetical protein ASD17_14605 [Sphingomonas sp. Root1294]|nr:hypothetical protein ASD17_14605 [Sphingomonas sp. Root1294]